MEPTNSDITEFGLLLPNGQVLWNNYNGRSLEAPADRQEMVAVLRKTAEECGFPEEQFTSHYRWVSRRVEITVTPLGVFALNDAEVVGVDNTAIEEDSGDYDTGSSNTTPDGPGNLQPGDSDGGDLRQGSVGGAAQRSA
jgi:hypothetical protein